MKLQKDQRGVAHLAFMGIIVAALVVMVGVYVAKQNQPKKTSSSVSSETLSTELAEPLPSTLLNIDKVKSLAATDAPNIVLAGIELQKDDGKLIYEVKLADGSHLYYDASTGAKITNINNDDETEESTLPPNLDLKIDFAKAREIALAKKTDSAVKKIQLEVEDGVVVFSVRFSDGTRIDINAIDGTVVRIKTKAASESKGHSSTGGTSGSSDTSSGSGSSTNDHDEADGHDNTDGHHDSSGSSTSGSGSNSGSSGSGSGGH